MSSYKRNDSDKSKVVLKAWVDCCLPRELESNIPEDCILIGSQYIDRTFNYIVLLMKKTDVRKAAVSLIVPNNVKHLAIGRNGQNVKKVAKLINASYVHVCGF